MYYTHTVNHLIFFYAIEIRIVWPNVLIPSHLVQPQSNQMISLELDAFETINFYVLIEFLFKISICQLYSVEIGKAD